METLHWLLNEIIALAILLFEYAGVVVLIAAGLRGVADCLRRSPLIRLHLAKGMALGLEFKLGSEILRTVVVREFGEILLVGGIILLRAALTLLIHWEIKNEERINGDLPEQTEPKIRFPWNWPHHHNRTSSDDHPEKPS